MQLGSSCTSTPLATNVDLWNPHEQNICAHVGSKGRKQLFKALSGQESPPEVPTVPLVLATFASKPLMMNGDSGGRYDFSVVNDCVTRALEKLYFLRVQSCLIWFIALFGSQCFWLDKQNMQIRETHYYTWYQDKTYGLQNNRINEDQVEM